MNRHSAPAVFACMALLLFSCRKKEEPHKKEKADGIQSFAPVSNDGSRIRFAPEEAKFFQTQVAAAGSYPVSQKVNARTIAAAVHSGDLSKPLIIFETQSISSLYSDYVKSRAGFLRTAKQLQRLKDLFSNNAASGREVLDAETENRQAEASLREAESRLREAGLFPKQLESMQPGTLLIVADVPEARIGSVKKGQTSTIEFNSFPDRLYHGRITTIGDAVDPTTHTILVGILLHETSGRIKPGMFARVTIEEKNVQAFRIPQDAVVTANAKTFVFVKTGPGVFERRNVVTGDSPGDDFIILSGLNPGDEVVITNAILLKGLSFGY